MLKRLLIAAGNLLFFSAASHAQCGIAPTAIAGTLAFASAVTAATAPNPMALVYNPGRSLYYIFYGGSSAYPVEVYNAAGTRLTTVAPIGYDFRGVWWNPTTSQVEGNGYNNVSIVAKPLDTSGYPVVSTVTPIFATSNGLATQNLAAFDPVNNEIVYYAAGIIQRVSRASNATVASAAVTGLPAAPADLNANAVLYTGCPGREYALYDATRKAVYFVSRATNAYVGTSLLPATAPANFSFGVAYANGQLYLFNYPTRTWNSYTVLGGTTTATTPAGASPLKLALLPNPAHEQVQVVGAAGAVRLLDMTGRLLREQPAGSTTLSLVGLPAGLYLVQSGSASARLQVE